MRMPKVSLQSPDLVQRHVNAWLLSHWLKHVVAAQEIKSMTAGVFFLDGEMPMPLAARFCLWCDNQAVDTEALVERALKDITRRSILDTTPQPELFKRASSRMAEIMREWRQEYSASYAQLLQISDKKAAASRAMEAQLNRITKEYLLSELADRRFLPGYGFPTDIVSFDNRCMQTLKRDEGDKREDNRARYRSLASRDRVTGLREYAPGAELVMDGLVYKSSVSLSTGTPPRLPKTLRNCSSSRRLGAAGNVVPATRQSIPDQRSTAKSVARRSSGVKSANIWCPQALP